MTTDSPHLDGLASLRDGRYVETRSRRPRSLRLDSDGLGITVEIPAPRVLVEVLDLFPDDVEVFRRGQALATRPRGSDATGDDLQALDLTDEARRLVEFFAGLPDRDDAGRPYNDLRLFARASPDLAESYLLEVLRALRSTLSTAPRPPRPARGGTSAAERKRRSRERIRVEEDSSARWWLENYLSGFDDPEEAPAPGTRVAAPDLYALASEALAEVVEEYDEEVTDPRPGSPNFFLSLAERAEEWEEYADDEGYPLRPRVPSSLRFYAVAEEVLGPRSSRSTGGLRYFTIPNLKEDGMTSTITREEIEEALEVREIVSALRDHKRRHETKRDTGGRFAPAADGTVVPLFG